MKKNIFNTIVLILIIILFILVFTLFVKNNELKDKINYNFDLDKKDFKNFCEESGGIFAYLDGAEYIQCEWEGKGVIQDYRGFN